MTKKPVRRTRARRPMTPAEFVEHAKVLQALGAMDVRVKDGQVSYEVEFPRPSTASGVGGGIGFVVEDV